MQLNNDEIDNSNIIINILITRITCLIKTYPDGFSKSLTFSL